MAATAYSVQAATHAGLQIAYVVPTQTTGHTAPTGPGVTLLAKNGSGASINVDVHVPGTVDTLAVATPAGAAAPARRIAVAAGADQLIPLPQDIYGDPNNGYLATFDVSAFASVNIACIRIA